MFYIDLIPSGRRFSGYNVKDDTDYRWSRSFYFFSEHDAIIDGMVRTSDAREKAYDLCNALNRLHGFY